MHFSRKIRCPEGSATLRLHRVERHLRRRSLRVERPGDAVVEAKLFVWAELGSAADADRFSWRRVRVEEKADALHLRMDYNWPLQLFAHLALSAFVVVFMRKFGSPEAVAPMLVSTNAILGFASVVWAKLYATKLTEEIASKAEEAHASDAWLESA